MDFPERPNYDDVPDIVLNADQSAVAMKAMSDLSFGIRTLFDDVQNERPINAGLAHNILALTEHRIADIGKVLKVETNSAEEIEARHVQLRTANLRIHELEKLLGAANTPQTTQMSLKNLHEQLYRWWQHEGFGHVRNEKYGPYGCEAELSCYLSGDFLLMDSKTPISDKELKAQWYASLEEQGLVLNRRDREPQIIDCDQSRAVVKQIVTRRMPSATIRSFENSYSRGDILVMRSVTVHISQLADIASLPVPPETEGEF